MDEQLMSWANTRPEVTTDIPHRSGLSIKIKYVVFELHLYYFFNAYISFNCYLS